MGDWIYIDPRILDLGEKPSGTVAFGDGLQRGGFLIGIMKVAFEFLEFFTLVVPDSNHGISTRSHDIFQSYFFPPTGRY
jgi:hypothetical protein